MRGVYLYKHRSFNQGQLYLVVSREPKLEKLHLSGHYCSSVIKVNENARREYERLRTQSKFIGVSKYLASAN